MKPEIVTPLLAMLAAFGTWLSVILTRRGKREDIKLQKADQAFDHMKELAETRAADLLRATQQRDAAWAQRDAAWAELDRTRAQWDARWDRQMVRCREVTAALVSTIGELRQGPINYAQEQRVRTALQNLAEHNEDHEEQE